LYDLQEVVMTTDCPKEHTEKQLFGRSGSQQQTQPPSVQIPDFNSRYGALHILHHLLRRI